MATRQIRTKKQIEANGMSSTREKRSFEVLIKEVTTKTAAAGLLNDEVAELIDHAGELDALRKELDVKVKKAKAILLKNAEEKSWKMQAGEKLAAKISPSTKTEIPVKPFLSLLKKLKKAAMASDLLSVRIGDAKKYLGEDVLKDVSDVEVTEYGSVSFTRLKR